jgi:hypothetical protein
VKIVGGRVKFESDGELFECFVCLWLCLCLAVCVCVTALLLLIGDRGRKVNFNRK